MNGYGGGLFEQHQALLAASAVSPEVARERGYVSVDTKKRLEGLGFSKQQRRLTGLLIPVYDETGQVALHQYRPDKPRSSSAGKIIKYETPYGARMVVDVPPRVRPLLGDPKVPLWATEGVRKADAAVTAGLACVALLGVWNWRGTNDDGGKTALAFWESVALRDRLVYIAFDSDVMLQRAVHDSLARLGPFLRRKGAQVAYVYLPAGPGGTKTGLDDYMAAGGTVEELVLRARTEPVEAPLPEPEEEATRPSRRGGDISGTVPLPARRTLAEVEEAFAAHHKHGDLIALRATLACYAANMHLDGDPVWLGLVSGSSTGKTETAAALAGCPHVMVMSTLSGEAALLSGTPAKERAPGATGGLLRELGERGVLVLKDFTTVLSMHPDKRAVILSALREVYDGYWSRGIGAEGATRLEWKGKLGLVMCATNAYDRAYGVVAVMGDRFLLIRLDDMKRKDGTRAALAAGDGRAARAAIAEAASGLLGHPPATPPLEAGDSDLDRLAELADFVTLARSPVARDFKGEIDLVLDPEGPYRFGKELYALWRACGLLGLSRAAAWEVAARVARDSMPRLRWRVLDALAVHGQLSTNALARAALHPARSTKRALEDLTAHQVVERVPAEGPGLPDHWRLVDGRRQAAMWLADGTVPEISPPLREDADDPARGAR